VDRGTRQAERLDGALLHQDRDGGISRTHSGHEILLCLVAEPVHIRPLSRAHTPGGSGDAERGSGWAWGAKGAAASTGSAAVGMDQLRPPKAAVSLKSPEWSRPPSPCCTVEPTSWATWAPSGMVMPAWRAAAVMMPMSLL